MKIGCLQFAPRVGDVDNNINRADAILDGSGVDELDLLVLPELAFSGYNFRSLQHISPFLEHQSTGITSLWARNVALRLDCVVIAGYPEKVDLADQWPADPEYYNSAIVVNEDGETIANYRKTHLYYTDEPWALEGRKFFEGHIPGLGPTAIGICMDLNPYKFQTPWDRFEFSRHVLDSNAVLVVVSMAWLTQEPAATFTQSPQEPDMATLMYWVTRFEPVIREESDDEIIVVFANRTGTEDEAIYVGTSAVIGIQAGEVRLYGILGRGEKDLLVVDTDTAPYAKLVFDPQVGAVLIGADADVDPGARDGASGQVGGKTAEKPPTSWDYSHDDIGPESNEEAPRKSAATYRRDDLSISLPPKEVIGTRLRTPIIHTPSAPSPTPHTVRPRFATPPVHSMTQSYLETLSPYEVGPSPTQQGQDVRLRPVPTHSPSLISESHFSQSSMESSRMYWTPLGKQEGVPPGISWELQEDSEDNFISDEESEQRRSNKNRYSIRSDVSVWNNQPGRPRSVASPLSTLMNHQALELQLRSQSVTIPASKGMNPSFAGEAAPGESSRARRQHANDDDVANNVSTSQTNSQRQTPSKSSNYGSRSNTGKDVQRTPQGIPSTKSTRPPIHAHHRAASEDRYHYRSELPKDMDRPQSHNDVARKGRSQIDRQSGSQSDSRQVSRGRQHNEHRRSDLQDRRLHSQEQHRAESANARPSEPVDLSQFALIEEIPSETCPMHGSRSRSGTGRRDGSTRRHLSQRASHSSMRNKHSRSTQQPEQGTDVKQRKQTPSKERKPPRPATTSATSSRRPDVANPSDVVETVVQSRDAPANHRTEPKTPVAMVLVYDSAKARKRDEEALSGMRCVEKGAEMGPSRPRSTVW